MAVTMLLVIDQACTVIVTHVLHLETDNYQTWRSQGLLYIDCHIPIVYFIPFEHIVLIESAHD